MPPHPILRGQLGLTGWGTGSNDALGFCPVATSLVAVQGEMEDLGQEESRGMLLADCSRQRKVKPVTVI